MEIYPDYATVGGSINQEAAAVPYELVDQEPSVPVDGNRAVSQELPIQKENNLYVPDSRSLMDVHDIQLKEDGNKHSGQPGPVDEPPPKNIGQQNELTYSEIEAAEDVKEEFQEEESMGEIFGLKKEILYMEVKDEKIEDEMFEEFKEEVVEEEPVRMMEWSNEESQVPYCHELMEETRASQKNERAARKAIDEAVMTCNEPYQNVAENIEVDKNGSSYNVKKHKQFATVPSERFQSHTREEEVEQKKCPYTAVSHFELSCSAEGDPLSFAPHAPAARILSEDTEIFTTEQEDELVKCLQNVNEWFDGMMYKDAQILIYKFAVKYNIKCHPSWDVCGFADVEWFQEFLRRHPSFSFKTPRNNHILSTGHMNHILNTLPRLINVTIASKDNFHKSSVCHSSRDYSHKLSRNPEFKSDHRYASRSKVCQIKSKKSVDSARNKWLCSNACKNKKQKYKLLNKPVSLENGKSDETVDKIRVKIVSTKKNDYIPQNVSRIIDARSDVCSVKHEWLFNRTPEKEKEYNILFSKLVSSDKDIEDFNEAKSDVYASETVFVDVEEDLFTHTKDVYY